MKYQEVLNKENPKIRMIIEEYGEIELELFPGIAPKTVENFLSLIKKGFYDGLTFHRIIQGFMIQGGDPFGTGMGGSSQTIVGEFDSNGFHNPLEHTRGVISMARAYSPNSASSQFFIMHENAPHLDGAYAAFGACTKGIEVVDRIAAVAVDANDRPIVTIRIKKAELI